jgi:O-antigen/teichoic acid export membrane protein
VNFISLFKQVLELPRLMSREFFIAGLGRNSLFSLFQSLTGILSVLIIYKLLIAMHGNAALGIWSLVSGLTALTRVADFSGGGALSRLVAISGNNKRAQTIDTVIIFVGILYALIIAIVFWPLLIAVPRIVETPHVVEATSLVPLSFLLLYCSVMASTHISALDGLQRADQRASIIMISHIFTLGAGLALIPNFGAIGLATSQIIQQLFILVASRVMVTSHITELSFFPGRFDRTVLSEILSYGSRLQITNIAALVFDPITRLVINSFGGVSLLAIFEIASKIVTQARAVLIAAATPLVPTFAQADQAENKNIRSLLKKSNFAIIGFSAVVYSAVILVSPLLCFIMLDEIQEIFVVNIVALCLGYMINSYSAALYFYAQGVGILKWNILGQMVIAMGSLVFGSIMGLASDGKLTTLGLAIGISLGSIVAVSGNLKMSNFKFAEIFQKELILLPPISFAISVISVMLFFFVVK